MKKENTKKIHSAVVRDSINTFGTNLFGAMLGLISSFIVLRRVDRVTKGLFNQMQQWGQGIFTILGLSAASAVVYFVARNSIKNVKSAIWRLSAGLIIGMILISSVGLFYLRDSSFFANTPRQFLVAIVVYGVLSLLSNIFLMILRGENKFKAYNLVNLVQRILVTALAVFIFLRPDATLWIWATITISVGVLFLALYGIVRWNGPKPVPAPENDVPVKSGEMVRYSLKSHVSNVLTYLNSYLGSYIVQWVAPLADYSVYNLAVTIMQQIWILPDAVSQVILSRIAGMTEAEDKARLTVLSSKLVTYITTVGAIALYWVAKLLVPLLFPMYVGALDPLPYLMIGSVFISYAKVLGNSIAAYGRPELNIIPTACGITLNIISSVILLPVMGTNGIAMATSISMTTQAITCIIIFCRFSHTPIYRLLIPSRQEISMVMKLFHK